MSHEKFTDSLKVSTVKENVSTALHFINQCGKILDDLSNNDNPDPDLLKSGLIEMRTNIDNLINSLKKLSNQTNDQPESDERKTIQDALDYSEELYDIIINLYMFPDNFNSELSNMDERLDKTFSCLNKLSPRTNLNSENTHSNPNSHKTHQSSQEELDTSGFC